MKGNWKAKVPLTEMQLRCVEVLTVAFISCSLLVPGALGIGEVPFQLQPMKCSDKVNFNALCKSACNDIRVLEFGFCGESIVFTQHHYNLTEVTISLGSIFDVGLFENIQNCVQQFIF